MKNALMLKWMKLMRLRLGSWTLNSMWKENNMKVHYVGESAGSSKEAFECWEKDNLIPIKTKRCTGTMMEKGNEAFFTEKVSDVTCGLCKRILNKSFRNKIA